MQNIKNIIVFVFGVLPDLKVFFNLRFLGAFDVIKACTLMVLVTIFEAVSVATFIPLLELLQNDGDLSLTKPPSVWWEYFDVF